MIHVINRKTISSSSSIITIWISIANCFFGICKILNIVRVKRLVFIYGARKIVRPSHITRIPKTTFSTIRSNIRITTLIHKLNSLLSLNTTNIMMKSSNCRSNCTTGSRKSKIITNFCTASNTLSITNLLSWKSFPTMYRVLLWRIYHIIDHCSCNIIIFNSFKFNSL